MELKANASKSAPTPLLIPVILLGSAILGAATIGRLSFWHDEIISIDGITNYSTLVHRLPEQMPAYYIALRGWVSLVGESEIVGRWLSLLLGLLTLSLTYRLARRYASPRAALWTLIILGSSAFFVRYYREMRPYTFLAFFCVVSMWFCLRWLETGKTRHAFFWLLANIIAVYTHYFAGLLIAAQGLYFLYDAKPIRLMPRVSLKLNRQGWLTLAIFALSALVLVPYYQSYLRPLSIVVTHGRVTQALTPAQGLNSLAQTLTNDSLGLFLFLAALAVLMRWRGLALALMWLVVPLVATLMVHVFFLQILVNPRYLIFIWPAMAMLAALGILTLEGLNRRAALIGMVVLVFIGVGQVITDLPGQQPGVLIDQPWREMTSTIGRAAQPNDLLIVNMVDPVGTTDYRDPLFYYLQRNAPSITTPLELDLPPTPDQSVILDRLQQAQAAWLMVTDGPPNTRGEMAIAALRQTGYASCQTWVYNHGTALSEWRRITGSADTFGQLIAMQQSPLNHLDQPLKAGSTITIELGLSAVQPISIDYSLGLYLFNSDNVLVAQSDGPIAASRTSAWQAGDLYCDARTITLPEQPGTYFLRTATYDSQSEQRLILPGSEDGSNLATLSQLIVNK